MSTFRPKLIIAGLLLTLIFTPRAFAAEGTTFELSSDVSQAAVNEEFTITAKVCPNGTVTSIDFSALIEGDYTATAEGKNLDIFIEESVTDGVISFIAGQPGGITECLDIGEVKITPTKTGKITVTLDNENIEVLGDAAFDPSIDPTVENKGILEITVGETATET